MLPSSLQRQFFLLAFASLLCAAIQATAQAGHLDPSFAKEGIFAASSGTTANAIAIQTDGKIVIAEQEMQTAPQPIP